MVEPPRLPRALITLCACAVIVLSLFIIVKNATSAPVRWHTATASWYGPGLFGNPLGCAGVGGIRNNARLYPNTVGVASTTLRCNQRIRLMFRGRKMTVRVIDRGPFVPGRQLDLTQAVAKRLKFTGVQEVRWRKY